MGSNNPTVRVRLGKLLFHAGFALKLDGELKRDLVASVKLGTEITLGAGKKMLKVSVKG